MGGIRIAAALQKTFLVLLLSAVAFLALYVLEASFPERAQREDFEIAPAEVHERHHSGAKFSRAAYLTQTGGPSTFQLREAAKLATSAPVATLEAPSGQDECHAEPHAEFSAEMVVRWGSENIVADAAACCDMCRSSPGCNVWVFCGEEAGCTADRRRGECWLKRAEALNPVKPAGPRGDGVKWTSGVMYSPTEYADAVAAAAAAVAAVERRRATMRADRTRPLVFLDVAIAGRSIGRMEFALFTVEAPLAAENFRALCTGEKGIAPPGHEGAGQPYHLKGAPFYRIIDQFIDQSGAQTDSVFGGYFKDDPGGLALKHDRGGLLSMANNGPDTNGAHFSIVVAPAPHLNGLYTVFGELVSGWDVAMEINALAVGKPDNTAGREAGAVIVNSGQIR